jgi:hypothetical protein
MFAILAVCSMLLFRPDTLTAQSVADTTLPDLAPREVEILGNLDIVFPSLRRQPLTGFNPPPRIFQVPRGRQPYAGEYKQASAEIPGTSLAQPATPPATISVGQNPRQGEVFRGVGSYLSREIRAVGAFDASDQLRLAIDLGHGGYDNFNPFSSSELSEIEAPYKTFDGSVGIEYGLGASTIGADVSGFSSAYTLYGLQPDSLMGARPDRDGSGFEFGGVFRGGSASSTPFTIEAGIGSNRYRTDFGPENVEQIESKESILDLAGETEVEISERRLSIDARLANRSVELSGAEPADGSTSVSGYHVGGDLVLELSRSSRLKLGLQFHGYSSSEGHVPEGVDQSKFYVAPRVEYRNQLARGFELYVQNRPVVRQTTQHDLYELNPFVVDGPLVLPELSVINSEAGLVYYAGPVRVSGRAGFGIYENYLVFDADTTALPDYAGNLFEASYGSVDMFSVGVDLGLAFPGSFSMATTADWRGATLDPDQDVPYLPSFELGLIGTYTFAADRAILQFDGRYVGTRKVDRVSDEELNGYLDLSALASYYVTPRIGVYVRANSITGDRFERWAGYPAADWIVLGGVRLSW